MASSKKLVRYTAGISHSGAPLIIAGLAALILVAAIPTVPAMTALSILTLGATNATLDRAQRSPAILMTQLLHSATYGSLYALFLGATLHSAASAPNGELGAIAALDIAASVPPAALALRRVAAALRPQVHRHR